MKIKVENVSRLYFLKGYCTFFSTCIEITGNNGYCFLLKKVENHREKFQRVKK